jgi:drug/metabolite transporter (DMT)-like permease
MKVNNPAIYAFFTAVFFGLGAPLAKVILGGVAPMMLAAFLYFGSGIGLSGYLLIQRMHGNSRHTWEAALQRSDLPWLLGVILFGGFLAPLVLMSSLQLTHAATASLLLNFEAVATTLIAVLIFREAVGRRIGMALALITGSCVLLTWEPDALVGFSLPALGVLLTCVFWALDNNFARNISAKDPLPIIATKGIIGGTLSLSVGLLLGETIPTLSSGLTAMVLGFFCFGGLISVFFLLALRGIGTSRSASILAISPLFGVPVAFVLFSDLPRSNFFVAAPIMAVGVWMLITEEHTHQHVHPAEVHEHRHQHDDLHHHHVHQDQDPPVSPSGEHSHIHAHSEIRHVHSHRPDIHHRHTHEESSENRFRKRGW